MPPPNEIDELPVVRSVAHFSDLSHASEIAFAHALAIALVWRSRLDILHIDRGANADWSRFPAVRRVLERWGLLAPGSERAAVYRELEVAVQKIQLDGNPVRRMLEYVQTHRPDLIVFASEGRTGIGRLRAPSVAETVFRRSRTMTLFVREGGRPFVALADGHLSIQRILVPVDEKPDATEAIARATRAAELLGDAPVEITLLHVGGGTFPAYPKPEPRLTSDGTVERWRWHERRREGVVAEEILAEAGESSADLIVMATDGRDGVLDAFRGSFTEQVVRRAPCPVLAVPAYS